MRHDKELLFFKALAVGGILLYLYKVNQKSPNGLMGNPYMNVNADKIAGLASQFVPHPFREKVQTVGSIAINRMMKRNT